MSWNSLSLRLLELSIQIPMLYHGYWNLFTGEAWWRETYGEMAFARYIVGLTELILPFLIALNILKKPALFVFIILMVGAIGVHFPFGYSFKQNGYETPLVYLLISLSLITKKEEQSYGQSTTT